MHETPKVSKSRSWPVRRWRSSIARCIIANAPKEYQLTVSYETNKIIEDFPKCFTKFSVTKVFVITVKGLEPATSCVRDHDATRAPARHMWETGSFNWSQLMLPWFSIFPEFAEFNESSAPFKKNSAVIYDTSKIIWSPCNFSQWRPTLVLKANTVFSFIKRHTGFANNAWGSLQEHYSKWLFSYFNRPRGKTSRN